MVKVDFTHSVFIRSNTYRQGLRQIRYSLPNRGNSRLEGSSTLQVTSQGAPLLHESREPSAVTSKKMRVPLPDKVKPDTPLRLSVAAALGFPDGSMTASGLRREGARGRLVIERVAG